MPDNRQLRLRSQDFYAVNGSAPTSSSWQLSKGQLPVRTDITLLSPEHLADHRQGIEFRQKV